MFVIESFTTIWPIAKETCLRSGDQLLRHSGMMTENTECMHPSSETALNKSFNTTDD